MNEGKARKPTRWRKQQWRRTQLTLAWLRDAYPIGLHRAYGPPNTEISCGRRCLTTRARTLDSARRMASPTSARASFAARQLHLVVGQRLLLKRFDPSQSAVLFANSGLPQK